MQLFYTTHIHDQMAYLKDQEARHCVQVLRKKTGDEIHFVDGRGLWARGTILSSDKKEVVIQIEEQKHLQQRPYSLHVAIAPPKNIDRFEWFLEKATEIGIDAITPIQTEHTIRTKLRYDRLEKVLVAAMKQCLTPNLPVLHPIQDFESFLKKDHSPTRLIGYCGKENLPHIKTLIPASEPVTILIGPEGDFSPAEFHAALENGWTGFSLGHTRLRLETAGVMVVAATSLANH